jgi:Fic family protein
VGWPALQFERLEWAGRVDSRWDEFGTGYPAQYAAAVPPEIAGLLVDLPGAVMQRAADATAALIRFDAQLGDRVAAFAPVLLRSEAAASSQIENLTASARRIFMAELLRAGTANAVQIAANTTAMQAAIDLAEDLSPTSIRAMHEVLMAAQPRHTPGEWRVEPVWIGTSAATPIGADYVAPAFERVPDLIEDLVVFSRRRDVEALVQVAIAHAQFETIHPFTDGNGRTGRAYAQSMLRALGVTRNVAIPVSAGLLAGVEAYHAALTAYRAGDPVPIIDAFADAALAAIDNATQLIADIDRIRAGWLERVTARRDSRVWVLLDLIARRPVITGAFAAAELGITPANNVYRLLNTLRDADILKSKREHEAGPVWRSDEILTAIDKFAERAGRRHPAR